MEEDKITKMFKENSKLVYFCYNKLKRSTQWQIFKDEVIGEGFLGLYKGCATFDENKGYNLSTYLSVCIYNQMKMFFRKLKKEPEYISLESAFAEDDEGNTLNYSGIINNSNNAESFDIKEYVDLYFKYNKPTKKQLEAMPIIIQMLSEGYRQIDIVRYTGVHQHQISRYVTKLKEAIIKEREKDVKRSRVE